MLKQGKISVTEAEELLEAVGGQTAESAQPAQSAPKGKPKFMRVLVVDGAEQVDVRIPLQLLRAGIKLGALIPNDAKGKVSSALGEKGINLDLANVKPEDVEALIEGLADMSVNVQDGAEQVRVFCE